MPYILFEDLKEILINYRSSRNNVISPYFAVEYDYFLRYFYDFKNLKFLIEKIDDGNISQLYERLTINMKINFPNILKIFLYFLITIQFPRISKILQKNLKNYMERTVKGLKDI